MACFTDIGSTNMRGGLTCCRGAVMATDAVSRNAGMCEHGIGKRCSRVAGVAFDRCRNVSGGFTDCHGAVVATAARTHDLGVIDGGRRCERSGIVARFAPG